MVYLLWLGIRVWRAPAADLIAVSPEPRSGRAIFARGVLVSLTYPKTLLFYGAFLPQFVVPGTEPGPQLALLAATSLAVAVALDSCWVLAPPGLRGVLRNRLTGGFYLAAAG
jgi:threonine/homoserine/homoserine lactone efflux protein